MKYDDFLAMIAFELTCVEFSIEDFGHFSWYEMYEDVIDNAEDGAVVWHKEGSNRTDGLWLIEELTYSGDLKGHLINAFDGAELTLKRAVDCGVVKQLTE